MYKHIIITIATLISLQTLAEDHPSAAELLDKYAATQENFCSFISKTENTIEFESKPNNPNFKKSYQKNFKREDFRYDNGKRANLRTHIWGDVHPTIPPVSEDNPSYTSSLADSEIDRWYGKPGIQINDPGTMTISKKTELVKVAKRTSLSRAYKGHEILGYLFGDDDRVDAVLRRANKIAVRDTTENISGSDCFVIDAVTERGKYTIWIDPQHGYNIAKAEVIRKEGDLIYDYGALKDGDQYYTSLSNVQFQQINGVWIPIEADIKYRWDLPQKYDYYENIHHKVTEFIINPDHEALGSFASDDIQNGAKVRVVEKDGSFTSIGYTWQDGKVIDKDGKVIMDFRPKKPTKK